MTACIYVRIHTAVCTHNYDSCNSQRYIRITPGLKVYKFWWRRYPGIGKPPKKPKRSLCTDMMITSSSSGGLSFGRDDEQETSLSLGRNVTMKCDRKNEQKRTKHNKLKSVRA